MNVEYPESDVNASSISDEIVSVQRRRLFPSILLAAILMTLAFPPADLGILAWVALVPLFYVIPQARRTRHAFALGYLFGVIHWGGTVTWIGTTVVHWAGTPWGWVAWVGLTAIQACWFGLFGGLVWWIGRRTEGHVRVGALAAAWTLVEWLRGQGNLAMPWSLSGYTQYRWLPLIQIADLAGVYAVAFLIAWVNAAIAEGMRVCMRPPQPPNPGGSQIGYMPNLPGKRRFAFRLLLPPLISLVVLLAYGTYRLTHFEEGHPITIALMQPNIWSKRTEPISDDTLRVKRINQDMDLFDAMAARAAPQHPLLMVWPESAAPDDAINDPVTRERFRALARASNAYQLVGTNYEDFQHRSYNSAALFAPDGRLAARYDKSWLVPFGEWIPARSLLSPFQNLFQFPKEDVVAGRTNLPIPAGPIRLGVLICFETVFSVVPRVRTADGANLLVSMTNDSWAGRSSEPAQHVAMAVLRAIETRRDVATSTTTGITGMIEANGRISSVAPYREKVGIYQAHLREGKTVYVRFGDWFVGLCALGLGLAFRPLRYREKGASTPQELRS